MYTFEGLRERYHFEELFQKISDDDERHEILTLCI